MRLLAWWALFSVFPFATIVHAEVYTITYFGTVIAGSGNDYQDNGQIFSNGMINLGGAPFVATFSIDDQIGITEIYSNGRGAFNQDVVGGLLNGGGNAVTATFKLNGTTISIGSYQTVGGWDIDVFNPPESGYIPGSMDRFGSFVNNIEYTPGNVNSIDTGNLSPFSIYLQVDAYGAPASLFPNKLDESFSILTDGKHYVSNGGNNIQLIGSNGVTTELELAISCVVGSQDSASIAACPASPLPSAAPEPTTWALIIMGLGATGAALRRRREGTFVEA